MSLRPPSTSPSPSPGPNDNAKNRQSLGPATRGGLVPSSPRPGAGSGARPTSELLGGSGMFQQTPEAEALDQWFENLQNYEATLEEMAAASLDANFKEELSAIEQWFKVLSEAERTAALYSLLQHSTQVQIRFFITVLQQMARSDPMTALLSPAMGSMQSQMEAKLATLKSPGLKSNLPASPTTRNFSGSGGPGNRASLALDSTTNFLSPDSAANPASDAAATLAQRRAEFKASNAAHRISAPVLASTGDSRGTWSGPVSSSLGQVAEQNAGGAQEIVINSSRPKSTEFSGTLGSPRVGSTSQQQQSGGDATVPAGSDSWASMVNTPLIPMFQKNHHNLDAAANKLNEWSSAKNAAPGVPRMGDPTIHRRASKQNTNNNDTNGHYDDNGNPIGGNGQQGGRRNNNNNNANNTGGWGAGARSPALSNTSSNRFGGGSDDGGMNALNGLGSELASYDIYSGQQLSQSPFMYTAPGYHQRRHPSTSPVMTIRHSSRSGHSQTSPISPTASKEYPCEICGAIFSSSRSHKRHQANQHIPSPVLHRCRYCRKEFSRADSLKRHLDNGCDEAPVLHKRQPIDDVVMADAFREELRKPEPDVARGMEEWDGTDDVVMADTFREAPRISEPDFARRMQEGDGTESPEAKLADEDKDIRSVSLSRDARTEMSEDALDSEWSGESSVNEKRGHRDEKEPFYHMQRSVRRIPGVINVSDQSTPESNSLPISPVTIASLECVVPAGIIDWAEQNADLWLKARELHCQLLPDICGDHDGWTGVIRLQGPHNRDVADYALELAAKSGASVYWIFRRRFDPETGKADRESRVNQISKLEDADGGASSSSDRGNRNGGNGKNSDGNGSRKERNGGDAKKDDENTGDEDASSGNGGGDGGDKPPEDPGKSSGRKQNRRNHNIVMSWRESGCKTEFVSTNLTLRFEGDEEKVKSNRERGVLCLGGEILMEDHGEPYKIGLGSTVSFFVNGSGVTSIKITKLPNREDGGIQKLTHESSAENSISFTVGNPFGFKTGRNTKNVKEVNNARETPPFYTCHLSAPDSDSAAFGIFPTQPRTTTAQQVYVRDPQVDLEIKMRPSAGDQPSIHIGMKICLRVERRFPAVERTGGKLTYLSTGMMLVHNVTIREAYAPASSFRSLKVDLPPDSMHYQTPAPVSSSDSLIIAKQDRDKYPEIEPLDSVKIELGMAKHTTVDHEESSCLFCMNAASTAKRFFKSLAGRSNIHETEHKKALGYIDTLYRNMEVNMIEISANSPAGTLVRPADFALMAVNNVRPPGF